jgi:GNAT superfamily N-acetyltransferase
VVSGNVCSAYHQLHGSQPKQLILAQLIERAPTLSEYHAICAGVGWENFINFEVAQQSLDRSLYHLIAVDAEQTVGMGRIVGDGAIYFYIQDIAVLPSHQGQGIGRAIMDQLMGWLHANAPDKAFVGLFASEGRSTFYQRYGFKAYPGMLGMFTVINR